MLEEIFPRDALLRIYHEHLAKHILALRGDVVDPPAHRQLVALDVLEQVHHVAGSEGRLTEQQLVEDGSDRPDVGLAVVLLVIEHLGGHIEG